jgi:hypothetical protein
MELFRISLPYCIVKLESGKWTFLNRKYKPVGINTNQNIDYSNKDYCFSFKRDPIKTITENSLKIEDKDTSIYYFLYDDHSIPYSSKKSTLAYFEKLERIMELNFNDE